MSRQKIIANRSQTHHIGCGKHAGRNAKSLSLATAAGIATYLITGVAVTEFAQPWIEFSLFVGLPAGVTAGAFAAAVVYLGLADDAPARHRRIAGALAGFGAVSLVVLIALSGLLDVGVTLALGIAFVVGVVAGIGTYVRGPRGTTPTDDEGETPGIQ